MLQNIHDSLSSFTFSTFPYSTPPAVTARGETGDVWTAEDFAQLGASRSRTRQLRRKSLAIQGCEQVSGVVPDLPSTETRFEPLRSFPKWLEERWITGESPRLISRESGIRVAGIYGMLKNTQRTIARAIDQSGREIRYPLRNKPIQYIDPIEPVADEDWEALR